MPHLDLLSAAAGAAATIAAVALGSLFRRPSAEPAVSETLAAILKGNRSIMTQLTDLIAKVTADDEALRAEVDAALAAIQGFPAVVAAAVAKALSDAGVDDAAATAALQAVDDAITAETAKVHAVLQAPPADQAPEPAAQAEETEPAAETV